MAKSTSKKPGASRDEKEYKVGPGRPPKHTQFGQPGGNPINRSGRKKKASIVRAIERLLAENSNSKTEEGQLATELGKKIIEEALAGEAWAAKLVVERMDGALLQRLGNADGSPIEFFPKALLGVDEDALAKRETKVAEN